jgi:flagellar protein FliS
MSRHAYQEQIDEEVLAASPLKFVHLLYRAALDSIASARRYLRLGDIRARSRAISKAMLIVTELSLSLNRNEGGELSRNLAELYAYVESLLIKANFEQCDPPLAEAERLLGTLAEAWETCVPPIPTPGTYAETPQSESLPTPIP